MDGAVLAGGKSLRMGQSKPFLELGGRPLIAWVLGALRPLCREVFIVADQIEPYGRLGCPVLQDIIPGQGPMGGIYTALSSTSEREVFVAACDTPFLDSKVVRYLASLIRGYEVVVPRLSDGLHPLQAVYTRDCLSRLYDCLMTGELSLIDFLQAGKVRVVAEEEIRPLDPQGISFLNVNAPEDLERATALLNKGFTIV